MWLGAFASLTHCLIFVCVQYFAEIKVQLPHLLLSVGFPSVSLDCSLMASSSWHWCWKKQLYFLYTWSRVHVAERWTRPRKQSGSENIYLFLKQLSFMQFSFKIELSSRTRAGAAERGSQGPVLQVALHGGVCRNAVSLFASLCLSISLSATIFWCRGGGGNKLMLLSSQQSMGILCLSDPKAVPFPLSILWFTQ